MKMKKRGKLLMIVGGVLFLSFVTHLLLMFVTPTHDEIVKCYDKFENKVIDIECIDKDVYNDGTYINYLTEKQTGLFFCIITLSLSGVFMFFVGLLIKDWD